MKIFAEDLRHDFAISRIAGAVKRYAPEGTEFVMDEKDAELVVLYAYNHCRGFIHKAEHLIKTGKEYAVVQLSVKSTPNPMTVDWLPLWEKAKVVWSYYDLQEMCLTEGNLPVFKFYYAPLGVDAEVFKETKLDRKHMIAAGLNRRESVWELLNASEDVLRLGKGVSDTELARDYSQCKYVSGLRKVEGFELPVIEGLLCGARPVCYDREHYRKWFEDFAEFIPESKETAECLKKLFAIEPRPVSEKEKAFVREKFDWEKIIGGFFKYV